MRTILRKRKILLMVLIAVVGLSVLLTVKFIKVNRAYPNPTLETYQMNQPVSFRGFEITARKFQMLDSETLIKQYKIDDADVIKSLQMYPTQTVLVTVTIKNIQGSDQTLSTALNNCNIQSFTFANGMPDDMFFIFNSKDSFKPQLKCGEQTTIVLPFEMIDQQFKKDNWNNIRSRKFDLVVTTYPVKKSIRLN